MALTKRRKVKKAAKKAVKRRAKKTVKKAVKRAVKKIARKSKPASKKLKLKKKAAKKSPKVEGNLVGLVTHYFPHVQAAVIKLKKPLANADTVKIKGHTTDLTQIITSMQIDRVEIQSAKKGDEIGLQVASRVRQGDKVYKV